jgi:hypothetical protein
LGREREGNNLSVGIDCCPEFILFKALIADFLPHLRLPFHFRFPHFSADQTLVTVRDTFPRSLLHRIDLILYLSSQVRRPYKNDKINEEIHSTRDGEGNRRACCFSFFNLFSFNDIFFVSAGGPRSQFMTYERGRGGNRVRRVRVRLGGRVNLTQQNY